MSLSPVSVLAASLRALSARAAEHSSPIALSQVLAEGFAAIAGLIENAQEQADAIVAAWTEDDRAEFVRGFVAGVAPLTGSPASVDTAAPQDIELTVTADQVIDAGPRGLEVASALQGLTADEFERAVTNARAILFGWVAE